MVIREATIQDGPELARLRWVFSPEQVAAGRQTFDSFADEFVVFLTKALSEEKWKIWVAAAGSRLIGNVYVEVISKLPRPGEFENRYAYLTNVYVEEAFRNKGVGSKLIEAATAWVRAEKLEFTMVWPSPESISFYENHGFVRSEGMERKSSSIERLEK